jgi:hypothetical protein
MASSLQYFDFVRNVWKNLSTEDRERMGELWKGFEQCVAAVYQKYVEASAGISVKNVFVYGDQRWLPYTFNSSNQVIRASHYTTTQDLSMGVNMSTRHLIKFSWDSAAPIEISLRGLVPGATKLEEIVVAINTAAGFTYVTAVQEALMKFTSPTTGLGSKINFYPASFPAEDASEYVLGIGLEQMPFSYPEYPYIYQPPYPRLVSIPVLQDAIRDENKTISLAEGTNYTIMDGEISFKSVPPESLWAKRNLFDEEWPWNNFGFSIDIYQKNSLRYAQVIQGLWFAFWTGPRPDNLRKALYLLFELPTAPFDGTITAVSSTSVTVTNDSLASVTYAVPQDLEPDVVLGERVEIFHPLVTGIDIFDKVNYPGFVRAEIDRVGIQRFLTENATRGPGPDTDETKALTMLEEYTFLPQISVNAFIKPDVNIGNVRLFLDAIKPVVKTYLFQVIIGEFRDPITLGERISHQLDIDVTPSVDSNETTFQETATLWNHELSPIDGLSVDTEGVVIEERTEIEVRSFGILIDYFEF